MLAAVATTDGGNDVANRRHLERGLALEGRRHARSASPRPWSAAASAGTTTMKEASRRSAACQP